MGRYFIRRLIQFIPVLLGITIISFGIMEIAPGDPTLLFLDRSSNHSPEDVQRVRESLGLDKPMPVRYINWLGRVMKGDLGTSFIDKRPVLTKIVEVIPYSFTVAGLSMIVGYVLAVLIGVVSAVRSGSWFDYITSTLSAMLVSAPVFWVALMAILLFSLRWDLLPSSGWGEGGFWVTLKHLILPVMILALRDIAGLSRYVRTSLIEALAQDFVRTARSKGMSERIVIYKHALRNALIPVVTIMGLTLPALIGGALLVENVFALPGMGRLAVGAVGFRDYPTIMGVNLVLSSLTVFGNLLADIMYGFVDPRIRYS